MYLYSDLYYTRMCAQKQYVLFPNGALQIAVESLAGALGVDAADGDLLVGFHQEAADVQGRYVAEVYGVAHVAPAEEVRGTLGEKLVQLLAGADGFAGEQVDIGHVVLPFQIEDGGQPQLQGHPVGQH